MKALQHFFCNSLIMLIKYLVLLNVCDILENINSDINLIQYIAPDILLRYVGNLDPGVTEELLIALFGTIGECKGFKIFCLPPRFWVPALR